MNDSTHIGGALTGFSVPANSQLGKHIHDAGDKAEKIAAVERVWGRIQRFEGGDASVTIFINGEDHYVGYLLGDLGVLPEGTKEVLDDMLFTVTSEWFSYKCNEPENTNKTKMIDGWKMEMLLFRAFAQAKSEGKTHVEAYEYAGEIYGLSADTVKRKISNLMRRMDFVTTSEK